MHASPMGKKKKKAIPAGVMKVITKFSGKRKKKREGNFFFFDSYHHEPVSFIGDCVESMHAKTRKMAIFA